MDELIIKERKFKENIVELINQANLPAMIISPVIQDVLGQLQVLEQQQYQAAVAAMENKENKVEEVKDE